MPTDFPDLESLKYIAEMHGFREIAENEPEEQYRRLLADHVSKTSPIEGNEIRLGRGWNKWTEVEKEIFFVLEMIAKSPKKTP